MLPHRLQQASRLVRGVSRQDECMRRATHHLLEPGGLGERRRQQSQRLRADVAQHVTMGEPFAGDDVRQPVMRQVRADHRHMARLERHESVPGHELSASLTDQVDFDLRMVVPSGQCARIPVARPPYGGIPIGDDHFKRSSIRVRDHAGIMRIHRQPPRRFLHDTAPSAARCPTSDRSPAPVDGYHQTSKDGVTTVRGAPEMTTRAGGGKRESCRPVIDYSWHPSDGRHAAVGRSPVSRAISRGRR